MKTKLQRSSMIAAGVVLAVAMSNFATAAPLCGSAGAGSGAVGVISAIGLPSSASGFVCEIGGLTFDTFMVLGAAGTPPFEVDLAGGSVVGNTIFLTFNPNLGNLTFNEDIFFYFRVTGGVTALDLGAVSPPSQGGSQPSVGEIACSAPIPVSGSPGANACPTGTQLAALTVFAGGPMQTSAAFARTSPIYIFKDIQTPAGTVMSSFTESFTTLVPSVNTPVPEPMTYGLIGSGLIGLSLLRRTKKIKV